MTNRGSHHQPRQAPPKEPLGESLKKIFLWTTGVFILLAIIGGIVGANGTPIPVRATTPGGSVAAGPVTAPAGPVLPPGAELVTVTRVIDGDTFEVGQRRIRVLGIESCEADTAGGRDATARAEEILRSPGNHVLLSREPGIDRDRYDRELRYVEYMFGSSPGLGVQDYGEFMVGFHHTGIYESSNDASDAYQAKMRTADQYTGRNCSDNPYASSESADTDVDVDRGRDTNLPDGALTGGYCARKWWC